MTATFKFIGVDVSLRVRLMAVLAMWLLLGAGAASAKAASKGASVTRRGGATPAKRSPAAARKPALTTLMYMVNRPEAIASFRAHADAISIIAPQSFAMDAEGFIGGEVPAEVLAIARQHGVAVMPLVVNRRFDQPLMHTVLDKPESRARAIRYLVYYALRDGYLGFQFDYENIHYTYQDRFTDFFREAAREFHRHGLVLSAAVVGKYSDDRNSESPGGFDNWSGVYDYRAMGKWADFLSIMAYPQHAGFSGPGPIAGLPWVEKIADYSTQQMPAKKVSLGIPLYGVQWIAATPAAAPVAADAPGDVAGTPPAKWKTRSLRYSELGAKLGGAQWDEGERAPHVNFVEQGEKVEAWYEDARSLGAKLELAGQRGLAGVSGWSLGSEDPAFWAELARYRIVHPKSALGNEPLDVRAKRAAREMKKSGN